MSWAEVDVHVMEATLKRHEAISGDERAGVSEGVCLCALPMTMNVVTPKYAQHTQWTN